MPCAGCCGSLRTPPRAGRRASSSSSASRANASSTSVLVGSPTAPASCSFMKSRLQRFGRPDAGPEGWARSTETLTPSRSRWDQAVTAATRHQSLRLPSPSTRSSPSSIRPTQPSRPTPTPSPPERLLGPDEVHAVLQAQARCRWVVGWGCSGQVMKPRHPRQHQQGVDARVVGTLDVRVQPVAHHQRFAATHPSDGLLEQRSLGLASDLGTTSANLLSMSTSTP